MSAVPATAPGRLAVVQRFLNTLHVENGTDADAVAGLVAEHDVVGIVVGLPITLAGREGPAAETAREFAAVLETRVAVPVELSDERLTTVVAHKQLRAAGRKGRKHRAVVDQVAAVGILQGWLDSQR